MRRFTLASGVIAALTMLFIVAAPALAAEESLPTPVLKEIEAKPGRNKGQMTVWATLSTAEGKPISDQPVEFYERVDFFGQRDAFLGEGTTDTTGVTGVQYQPSETGQRTIVVVAPKSKAFAAANAIASIQVQEVVPAFHQEPLPLASVRQWLPAALGFMVLATWAVLLGTFARVAFGIRAAAAPSRSGHQPVAQSATVIASE